MNRKRIFFRNNGLAPVEILKFWRYNKELVLKWPQFENRKVIFTHLGRIGNVIVCRLSNIQIGDEILVPSYNCGSEIDPFLCFGMKAVMYRVDNKLNIDMEDMQKRITKRTKIIYVTHFFGWPQPLKDIIKFCKEYNIFLLEDCALSLFSNGLDGPIGLAGDAAIHSFRKTLPVPDGAALVLRSSDNINSQPVLRPSFQLLAKEIASYVVRWLINSMQKFTILSNFLLYPEKIFAKNSSEQFSSDNLDMPKDYYFSENVMPLTISRISSGILSTVDPAKVFHNRRRNYKQLLEGILDINNLEPLLGNLPEGVCPLLMPLLVPDVFRWKQELNRWGIKAIRWWEGFNKKLSWEQFPEAKKLKNELLVLPVHQYLNHDDVDYMISCIREIANSKI
ncbi:MAG: aminotransferase class V-fold PLP-dependent enzyme [Candidatus Hodarchaeota archaeon]